MTTEITVFKEFEADLKVFEAADAKKQFDVTTAEGYAACKAYHAKLRKVYNGTDKLRASTKETALGVCRAIDAEAKGIFDRIDAMANPRKAMIAAEDEKEKKVIADLAEKNRLEAEYDEDERQAWLEYRERKAQAIIDAADKVEREAKAKLKDAADAVKAKASEDAAVAKALHKAENNRIAAELAEKIKQDEADAKEAERVVDVANQRKIQHEIYKAIETIVGDMDYTQSVLNGIIDGSIPHVTINY